MLIGLIVLGYKLLCDLAITEGRKYKDNFHLYIILGWNYGLRSVSTGHLKYNFISWDNDSIKLINPSSKNNQSGMNTFER